MTVHLYFVDPYLQSFDAQVVCAEPRGQYFAVTLDRTAFYPTGGGQQHDTGFLSDEQTQAQVLDVLEQNGDVVHLLDRPLHGTVHGEIDWVHRFDLTQQHTGQHILSQAFVQLFDAETISVHMTEKTCTLDLPRHLSGEQHRQAEQLANQVVQSNRPVRAAFIGADELARLPLRKAPAAKHEVVRIVEIEDFDWSPCGGTHVRATGEIGMIKVLRAERRGAEQRIEFTCGMRALHDYGSKNEAVLSLAAQLSVKDTDVAATVRTLLDEAKVQRRQLNAARSQMLDHEAERLWTASYQSDGWRIVSQVFAQRPLDDVRQLASRLREKPATVVIFALSAEKPNLVFARSGDLPLDMGALLREVSAQFGGRGGGQPELAQGGVAGGTDLAQVLGAATKSLRHA